MSLHPVRTKHIQSLVSNALYLAQQADGQRGSDGPIRVDGSRRILGTSVEVPLDRVLEKAAADLRHAAEELEAERLSVLGWAQV